MVKLAKTKGWEAPRNWLLMILFLSLIQSIPKNTKEINLAYRFYPMTTSWNSDLPSWDRNSDDHQVDEEVGLRLRPKWDWPRLASRCHGPTWFRKMTWWWPVITLMISDHDDDQWSHWWSWWWLWISTTDQQLSTWTRMITSWWWSRWWWSW